jgi:mannose-6-phosphate isomerase
MQEHRAELLGGAAPAAGGRFPLLCKLLDAHEQLSLQVHPPPRLAHLGDPKTEMWFIAAAASDAELFVGLRPGVTRESFERAVADGRCADCFHRVPVRAGDVMFLPSGRVHAIGAGLVIFEIQQNSDTTFRVYDWDRVGLDGQPRPLHVLESLESIDFADVEPGLVNSRPIIEDGFARRLVVRDVLFDVDAVVALQAGALQLPGGTLRVIAATERALRVEGGGITTSLSAGEFALLPAEVPDLRIVANAGAGFLLVSVG